MDPKLKAILQKAKQIDKAASKYDTTSSPKPSASTSLFDQMGTTQVASVNQVDVNSSQYQEQVKQSKLPPEIQKAMMESPIPQQSMMGEFNEQDVKDLNPGYDENMGYDFMTEQRHSPRANKQETNISSNGNIRGMIAEEIAKALPSIIEKYFDKKMIQENINLLKKIKGVKRK